MNTSWQSKHYWVGVNERNVFRLEDIDSKDWVFFFGVEQLDEAINLLQTVRQEYLEQTNSS